VTPSELERLALRCLFPGFPGVEPPDWVRRRLADGLGGVLLYARNVETAEQVARLSGAIHAERPGALVAIDEEGGDVTRLEAATGSSYPGNAALGVVDDVELTAEVGAAIGADLADAGVDLDLAPVADVNSNPSNPIIGIRSFGADPELVARHVEAFVRGLQDAGVAACAKHFPGHGDADADSHLELPTISVDRETLILRELVPFRAAIDAGARSIMTAHIVVPALDDGPATTSGAILRGLLREELGFDGVVMTDALEMRAISATVGVEEGAVRALAAGADALCLGHDLGDESVGSILVTIGEAVRSGRLQESRLADAAQRVEALATWVRWREQSPSRGRRDVGIVAARRALEVEGDVRLKRPAFVVELGPEPTIAAGHLRESPADWFRHVVSDAEVVRLHDWTPGTPVHVDGRQLVVISRDAHRHAWERQAIDSLLADEPDAILIEVGLSEWRPAGVSASIATFGAARVNIEAAAERLYSGTRRGVEQSGSSPGS
jgi:beta-N-acetylhexosaminidase